MRGLGGLKLKYSMSRNNLSQVVVERGSGSCMRDLRCFEIHVFYVANWFDPSCCRTRMW